MTVINFSDKAINVTLQSKYFTGKYKELFTEKDYEINGDDLVELPAWGYLVLYGK